MSCGRQCSACHPPDGEVSDADDWEAQAQWRLKWEPLEAVPRIGATFEDWDTFDRHRFDGDTAGWPLLYRRYQQVGQLAVGERFRLGVDALVLEVVRFRSAKGAGIKDAVLGHERPLTMRLLHDAAPRVIISNGSDSLWELRNLFPALADIVPPTDRLRDVVGSAFRVPAPELGIEVTIVAAPHLSGAFGLGHSALGTRPRVKEAVTRGTVGGET